MVAVTETPIWIVHPIQFSHVCPQTAAGTGGQFSGQKLAGTVSLEITFFGLEFDQ